MGGAFLTFIPTQGAPSLLDVLVGDCRRTYLAAVHHFRGCYVAFLDGISIIDIAVKFCPLVVYGQQFLEQLQIPPLSVQFFTITIFLSFIPI